MFRERGKGYKPGVVIGDGYPPTCDICVCTVCRLTVDMTNNNTDEKESSRYNKHDDE